MTATALTETHVPFEIPSLPRRMKTALGALWVLARDHGRLDQVLVLLQAINIRAIVDAASRIEATPEGATLLRDKPRIDKQHVDFAALERLPDGTLGREYVRFLSDNGITPDVFEALPSVGDERAAWIMLRMRQTHDLWHVLTGYAPDVRGEVLLQAFTYAQTNAPGSFVLAFFGTLRWLRGRGQLRALREAHRRGKATKFLPTFRWEEHWATPVSELRELLACPSATQ
jgi:ubiquinone biosynthesis protein COQ4